MAFAFWGKVFIPGKGNKDMRKLREITRLKKIARLIEKEKKRVTKLEGSWVVPYLRNLRILRSVACASGSESIRPFLNRACPPLEESIRKVLRPLPQTLPDATFARGGTEHRPRF